jgi:uncharacterized protein
MWPLAAVLVAGYVLLCVVLYLSRDRLVFPIRGGGIVKPYDGDLVEVPVPGAIVRGWHLPGPPAGPVLLWFHGNGETVHGLGDLLRAFKADDFGLIAVDYRGYGGSSGSPTPANTEDDAVALFDWAARRYARVVVYGRSIGSGPAVWVASRRQVAGLILESPFTSLRDLARKSFPLVPPVLAGRSFDNLARIGGVKAPVLIIAGEADRLIPPAMGQRLYERVIERGGTAQRWVIPGAEHNTMYDVGGVEYVRRVRTFITSS